jgi:CDP-diacylglycerol---glycerol-3-phosphate 3-phosphatidyltransferase
LNLPLCLTLSRILFGPLFIAIFLYYEEMGLSLQWLPYILILLTIVSELSDLFDGFFARRHNKVTELGKLLDPMADSIFRLSVLLAFTQGFLQLPLLLVVVFFYRTLRTICALRGVALAARWSGKIKAVILAIVIFFILILMIPYSLGYLDLATLRSISFYSVFTAALYVVYSCFEYVQANHSYIKKALGF